MFSRHGSRRDVLRLGLTGGLIYAGAPLLMPQSTDMGGILIPSDNEGIVRMLALNFPRFFSKQAFPQLRVRVPMAEGGERKLILTRGQISHNVPAVMVEGEPSSIMYLCLKREERTGLPAIHAVGIGQNQMFPIYTNADGTPHSFPLFELSTGSTSERLVWGGIAISALAITGWLGVKVISGVAAAIGFLAFPLLVIGIATAALGLIPPLAKWFREQTGWNKEAIARLFKLGVDEIRWLFERVVEYLTERIPKFDGEQWHLNPRYLSPVPTQEYRTGSW